MISAILIYGRRGEVLASRIYKDGLRRAVTDAFRVQVVASSEVHAPLLTLGSTSFLYIRYESLYVVAVSRHDVDAIAIYELLYKLCEICVAQFGAFDEDVLYRNVTQIYEILDELVDFGYPQNTEPGVLNVSGASVESAANELGVVSSLKRTLTGRNNGPSSDGSGGSSGGLASRALRRAGNGTDSSGSGSASGGLSPTLESTSEVPWRRSDIKHRRNEVYVDVIEHLNMVSDLNGNLLSASIDGSMKVRAQLSGLPNCQIDLSQNAVLENSQLHACIDHARFEKTGQVRFIPPEGEFELLRYRVTRGIKIPLTIENQFTGNEHVVQIRCPLDKQRHLTNVTILVPIPPELVSETQRVKSTSGKAKFVPEKSAVQWKIGRLSGQHTATLRIATRRTLAGHGPISAKFTINMFASSMLKVQSLQVVEESKYTTLKWVRYLTEAGSIEARMR